MGLLLIILIIILLFGGIGTLPAVGWHSYGYGPSGILFIVLVVVLILILLGRA